MCGNGAMIFMVNILAALKLTPQEDEKEVIKYCVEEAGQALHTTAV